MEELFKSDNMYPKINEPLNNLVNNSKFKIQCPSEIKDTSIVEIRERRKINKYIGKNVYFLEFFDINLVFLSVTSVSITIVSFI